MEERRKKRERRRTLALTRLRSVSCETLTLLDTSDMDSCCSEWDDDEDLSASSHNYVTLNRPISRRRILETSQCDSEDSGIEYQSNEDDTCAGDQSGGEEGRKEDDQLQDDIHGQETATESDDDDVATKRGVIGGGHNDVALSSQSRNDSDLRPESVKKKDKTDEEEEEEEKKKKKEEEQLKEVEVTEKEELVEKETKMEVEEEKEGSGGGCLLEMSAREVLENDKVVIVEKTPPAPPPLPLHPSTTRQNKKTCSNKNNNDAKNKNDESEAEVEAELREKRAAYTIRNKEVQLAELPPPHTVRSVRQLFEDNSAPLGHMRAWRDLGRFRDIKSNPSSKILRFDRNDNIEGAVATRLSRLGSSFTLPRLPSQRPNPATPSSVLPRHLRTSSPSKRPPETKDAVKTRREIAATESGQVVTLRKPTVHGFNVKKALQEDPRTFHAHAHATAPTSKIPQALHARRSQGAKGRGLNPNETTDRSDTESLSSDISEDSGVNSDPSSISSSISSSTSTSTSTSTTISNPSSSSPSSSSSSSSSSSRSFRSLDAYTSDPSFKWIDPAVMAKIRSVGTTVIFFGPRQRASQSKGSSCSLLNRPLPKHLLKTTPPAAPRIVGVLRKKPLAATPPGRAGGGAAPPESSVVYDFTRHQAAPWI